MRAIGRRVLVEIITTKKERHIFIPGNKASENEYESKYKILQLGEACPTDILKVGDTPIFEPHSIFTGSKTIEEIPEKKVTRHAIISYDEIAGVE